jgi:hypothetical protein
MFDRNAYWLDKILRLVSKSPGITFTQLGSRTKKLTSHERERFLLVLRDAGKIRFHEASVRGRAYVCYWAIDQATAPTATPGHQAAKQLDDARRLLTAGLGCIDRAMLIVSDLAAQAGGPMPAPDRGPVGVELRAGDAAMAV